MCQRQEGSLRDQTDQSRATQPRIIDWETATKALAVLVVLLPITAIFARWLALTLTFSQAPLLLAAEQSLGDLTTEGALLALPSVGVSALAYFLSRPSAASRQSTSRRGALIIAGFAAVVVVFLLALEATATGFPGNYISIFAGGLVGQWIGRRAARGPMVLRDLIPAIVATALITAIASGISGEVAATANDLIYLTPCDGRGTLVAVRADHISNLKYLPVRYGPSFWDVWTKGKPISVGFPDHC